MEKILGIDTGGTYTDGVILKAEDRHILAKTKTLTTRRNLSVCIRNCMDAFSPADLEGVGLVCLSTTLATNAIVEGRGCREGLLLIGGRPEGKMPTERYRVVQGRPDIMGRLREPLDPEEVDAAIEAFRGQVDAVAVSGYASVRNPEHEIYVKERIREKLGVPVVCAHDLTGSLGFYERTVTADLNAKLIPLICDLIDSVQAAMERAGIHAPLMIVKGDGTLMTEACARDKPIETILSGPAASVMGGLFLSGQKDAIILDMGGTTTDLANITDGRMRMNNQGANVGGWFTRIRAAAIYTVGLGGDSRIYLDGSRRIGVGPRKVIPYCVAATWFPALERELQELYDRDDKPHHQFRRGEGEAYLLTRYFDFSERTPPEQQVLHALEKQPHTLYTLQTECRLGNVLNLLERMMAEDILSRIALTPTDILHAEGVYTDWNAAAAGLAVQMMADQLGVDRTACVEQVRQTIARRMDRACIQSSLFDEGDGLDKGDLIEQIFLDGRSSVLGGSLYLKKPVIAIGAPARAWAGGIAHDLGTEVIFPPHAEVANAVGAAVGPVSKQVDLLIRLDAVTKTYTLFTPARRLCCDSLEQATEQAKAIGRECACAELPGDSFDVTDQVDDVLVEDHYTGKQQFVERRVQVTAVSQLGRGLCTQ